MGDAAKAKRREQLKRWAGSCTDREPAVPRRRWRGDAEHGEESEAVNNEQPRDQCVGGDGSDTNIREASEPGSHLLKRR